MKLVFMPCGAHLPASAEQNPDGQEMQTSKPTVDGEGSLKRPWSSTIAYGQCKLERLCRVKRQPRDICTCEPLLQHIDGWA
ncbi:hypothetical protein P7K49_009973 [Saguinus oedipus]|uniref:Uncharacterized protein n=1 Tax=Saguinus oedipus TaxID=9490 RepID=A0ABQ9VPP9_SAGOE|nr:hypothetical protein P7K49_009973 [Saguinus oedipus]